ncbi:MAG: sulfurtransferase [Gemmatimonadota bacterium]
MTRRGAALRLLALTCTLGSALAAGCGGSATRDPARAAGRSSPETPPPRLVSTEELQALLETRGASVLDVRPDLGAYLQGHLAGAVHLHTETLRASDRGIPNLLLPLGSYRTIFSRLGVDGGRPVVVYSAGEARNIDATYVAWILAGLGHPDVRVLDGGFGKWELEGRPLTRELPELPAGRFDPSAFQPEHARLEDVRAALGRSGVVLVDARPPAQYTGQEGPQARRGHIPGAVNHYWQDDLVSGEFARVWKPLDELRASYRAQGVTPDLEVIAYCNGGLESSHVHFTLRYLLGYPRVRVYDGSYTEWSARDELPVATGPRG